MANIEANRNSPNRRCYAATIAALLILPLLYIASIGPVTPILLHHGGDHGYIAWDALYGRPLGKLPKPCRDAVNKYLSYSDKLYWRIRKGRRWQTGR